MVTPRRTAWLVAALALGAMVTACDGDAPGATEPDPSDPPWAASADALDTGGLVWASGTTVHLGDGSTVELGRVPEEYVVAGDGVYFTAGDTVDSDSSAIGARRLYVASRDGSARGVAEGVADLRASPDGRYLVFLDVLSNDEKDRFGTVQVETVVVDLQAGEEVVRSAEGMGDTGSDDLADLLSESEISVMRVTADTAYVGTGEGDYAFDLATGEAEPLDSDDRSWDRRPGDLSSPDGGWRIVDTPAFRDRLVSTDGRRVTPRTGTPRWDLDHWTPDGRLAVGIAISGPGRRDELGPRTRFALVGCAVPSGRCEVVAETTGLEVLLPAGQADYDAITLRPAT